MNLKNNERNKKAVAILKFGILILVLIGIPIYIYFFHRDFLKSLSDFDVIKSYFENNKIVMAFVYMGMQCLQIVISMVPGQWLQIAAGYFYGIPMAYTMSVAGAVLGTVTSYYLAKVLGRDAMYLFFGKNKIDELILRLNSKKAMIIIFIIFLIPGIPKDICSYGAGLSNMKLKAFLAVSLLGRTPGMLGSVIIGRQLYTQSYVGAVIVGALAIIACLAGVIYRKKINAYLDGMYDKYISQ